MPSLIAASVLTMEGLSNLGIARMGSLHKASISARMAACAGADWLNTGTSTPSLVRSWRGAAIVAK